MFSRESADIHIQRTDRQTYKPQSTTPLGLRQTDRRYQVHYLPALRSINICKSNHVHRIGFASTKVMDWIRIGVLAPIYGKCNTKRGGGHTPFWRTPVYIVVNLYAKFAGVPLAPSPMIGTRCCSTSKSNLCTFSNIWQLLVGLKGKFS